MSSLTVENIRTIDDETNLEREGAGAAVPAPIPLIEDQAPARREEKLPEGARRADDGGIELALRYPVSIKFRRGDGTVKEENFERLSFRRLKGADLRAMTSAGEGDLMAVMIGRALGIGQGKAQLLYDAMDAVDCAAAIGVIRFLSGSGQTTGP